MPASDAFALFGRGLLTALPQGGVLGYVLVGLSGRSAAKTQPHSTDFGAFCFFAESRFWCVLLFAESSFCCDLLFAESKFMMFLLNAESNSAAKVVHYVELDKENPHRIASKWKIGLKKRGGKQVPAAFARLIGNSLKSLLFAHVRIFSFGSMLISCDSKPQRVLTWLATIF